MHHAPSLHSGDGPAETSDTLLDLRSRIRRIHCARAQGPSSVNEAMSDNNGPSSPYWSQGLAFGSLDIYCAQGKPMDDQQSSLTAPPPNCIYFGAILH